MKPDPFEESLQRAVQTVPRYDPTPAWKVDILASAQAAPQPLSRGFPRFLLAALATAWMGIVLLSVSSEKHEFHAIDRTILRTSSPGGLPPDTSAQYPSLIALRTQNALLDLP